MNTKDKFRIAINAIIDRDDTMAKKLIKEGISEHPKMQEFKTALSEMGLDYKKVSVPDSIYEDLENVIAGYDKPVQLKILDAVYIKVTKNNNL